MDQTFLDSSFVVTADTLLVVTGSCECKMERVETRKGVRE